MAGTENPSVVVRSVGLSLSLDSEYRLSAVSRSGVSRVNFSALRLYLYLETVSTVFLQIPTQICTSSHKQERGHRLNKFTAKNNDTTYYLLWYLLLSTTILFDSADADCRCRTKQRVHPNGNNEP
jgi:hypothetical protein